MTTQAERRCPACSAAVSPEAQFCVACGTAIPETVSGPPWRAREGIFIFLIHVVATGFIAYPLALLIKSQDAVDVTTIVVVEIALFITTLLWVRIRYGAGLGELGLAGGPTLRDVGYGLAGFLGGLAAALVMSVLMTTLLEQVRGVPVEAPQQIRLDQPPEGFLLVLLGIAVVGMAPIAEELFFRGFVFRGLRRWARPWTAIAISAVTFGLVHLDPTGGEAALDSLLVIVPVIATLGVVLAWLVEKTGRLAPAIVTHMAFNALNFALLFRTDRLS